MWQTDGEWDCFFCDRSNTSNWRCGTCHRNIFSSSTTSSASLEIQEQKQESKNPIEFIDIGVNLLDGMFQGEYHGKKCHEGDREKVIERAHESGVKEMIVTAGTLQDAKDALMFVNDHSLLFSTVGTHPTRAGECEEPRFGGPDAYMNSLLEVITKGAGAATKQKVVAIGECGLDYDRLNFCSREVQLKYFERHFELAEKTGLPMFFHNRNTQGDFVRVIKENRKRFSTGVVHSFDGSMEELQQLLALDLYIGINGCSLKTEENLETAKAIPDGRLMVETDAPWCGIKASHAGNQYVKTRYSVTAKEKMKSGLVKDRNEPCYIRQVCEVLAAIRGCSVEQVASVSTRNARNVFFSKK